MPRVFVVQEPLRRVGNTVVPRINYNTLKPYGEMVFLFSWGQLEDDDCLNDVTHLIDSLRHDLADFSDSDFIVCLGNPALIGMAISIAAEANHGRVKILDWLRNERRYRVVAMDLDWIPT